MIPPIAIYWMDEAVKTFPDLPREDIYPHEDIRKAAGRVAFHTQTGTLPPGCGGKTGKDLFDEVFTTAKNLGFDPWAPSPVVVA